MRSLCLALAMLVLAACAQTSPTRPDPNYVPGVTTTPQPGTVDSTSGLYVPKHPDLDFPDPEFKVIAPRLARDAYRAADALFRARTYPGFNAVMVHAADVFIAAHRTQAIACTDAAKWPQGPGMAIPDCVWPLPFANDWLGCMALQFPTPDVLDGFGYDDTQPLFVWTDRNYDEVSAKPEGALFLRQLNGTEKLGAQCEHVLLHPEAVKEL